MSEDRTAETNGSRTFEERVFARFDALDGRMDRMEARMTRFEQRLTSVEQHLTLVDDRLERLEARQYDTEPIWERVLAELGTMKEQIASLDRKFDVLTKDMVQLPRTNSMSTNVWTGLGRSDFS
jgi:archaellum component FlaC